MISSGDRQKYKSAKWKILGRVVKFSKSFLFRIRSRYDSFHTRWETEVPSRTNVDRRFSSKIILFVFEKDLDRIGICSHTRLERNSNTHRYPRASSHGVEWGAGERISGGDVDSYGRGVVGWLPPFGKRQSRRVP